MTPRMLSLTLLLAAGCTDPEPEPFERGRFVADNSVDESDPRFVGETAFLYDTWGVEVLDDWPPASFMLQLMEDEPEVFGNQYEAFGFLPDPQDEFPVGFKRGTDDPERLNETCALCHTTVLPDGRVWLGAPNQDLDIGAFRNAVNERWVAAGGTPFLTELTEAKNALLGPGRTSAESRTYEQVVAVSPPPYYELGERNALNYMGTGKDVRTEIYFAIYTFGAGDPNEEEAIVPFPHDEVGDLVDYMGQIAPPEAPAGDAERIAAGEQVFEDAQCGSCHHIDDVSLDEVVTLDKSADGVELLPGEDPEFPRGTIRTSDLHRVLQDGEEGEDGEGGGLDLDEGLLDLVAFIFANELEVTQTDGYRPSSLRGLWHTAPYLHNGSVPTLQALLTPPEDRPTTFEINGFTVDTSLRENDNRGHTFGTGLPEADKEALIAFLMSL